MGIVPTVKGADEVITDPIKKTIIKFRDEAPYFQLYYDQFLPPAVGGMVNDAVEALFAGQASPEEAAAMIEDAAAMELD
jgi:raffinose/stachyose/melibiose transport system substrate-binding protein